nr:MAG TPA: hypothetical protein [Bacteriophage sp.]
MALYTYSSYSYTADVIDFACLNQYWLPVLHF